MVGVFVFGFVSCDVYFRLFFVFERERGGEGVCAHGPMLF